MLSAPRPFGTVAGLHACPCSARRNPSKAKSSTQMLLARDTLSQLASSCLYKDSHQTKGCLEFSSTAVTTHVRSPEMQASEAARSSSSQLPIIQQLAPQWLPILSIQDQGYMPLVSMTKSRPVGQQMYDTTGYKQLMQASILATFEPQRSMLPRPSAFCLTGKCMLILYRLQVHTP